MDTTRNHLIALHKAIIDAERLRLEQLEGRITGAEMLQRLIADDRFTWLRPLTELIVRLDEEAEVGACLGLARQMLVPAEGDGDRFQTEYARLLQESPDVVLAHASAIRALRRDSPSPVAVTLGA